ncbi:CHRD domain-containing protein, partial [Streptomyces sp. NPDC058953]|uniref:CHRD domain-containing protein n=1 Tax=Streptomyces sp. NPDC058953 TaxID=3346676 RepID=UPI0036CF719C
MPTEPIPRRRGLLVAAQALLLTAAVTACADPAPSGPVTDGTNPGAEAPGSPATAPSPAGAPGASLVARLDGGPGVGAVALLAIDGDTVTYSLTWSGFRAPRSARIVGGDATTAVELFGSPLPDSATSVAGRTTVTDAALAERLRTAPTGFAVSVAAPGLPGGTLGGAVAASPTPVDPLGALPAGVLRAVADGRQESGGGDGDGGGGGTATGDRDAETTVSLSPGKGTITYSLTWRNLEPPTAAHVHRGALGQDGEIAIPLFTTPVPANVTGLAGTAPARG